MSIQITERQEAVLRFLVDFMDREQKPPTIREIGDQFGIGSLRGVTVHLDALARKGYLTRVVGKGSAIKLLPKTRDVAPTEKDRLREHIALLEDTRRETRRVLEQAEGALASCYQVVDWPADGTSDQDVALRDVRALLQRLKGDS